MATGVPSTYHCSYYPSNLNERTEIYRGGSSVAFLPSCLSSLIIEENCGLGWLLEKYTSVFLLSFNLEAIRDTCTIAQEPQYYCSSYSVPITSFLANNRLTGSCVAMMTLIDCLPFLQMTVA